MKTFLKFLYISGLPLKVSTFFLQKFYLKIVRNDKEIEDWKKYYKINYIDPGDLYL